MGRASGGGFEFDADARLDRLIAAYARTRTGMREPSASSPGGAFQPASPDESWYGFSPCFPSADMPGPNGLMASAAETPSASPLPELTGIQLGPYQLRRFIGSGGLGAVYEATDASATPIALKVLGSIANLSDTDVGWFSREAALKYRLEHPNIVKVVDVGVYDGMACLAMELVPGTSLGAYTRPESLLPMSESLRYAAETAMALGYAHARGIVHRDVKPDNILVDRPAHQAKLADFGVAMFGDGFRTQTGVIPGTPAYMSPEQLCGGVIDGRTDLYALGVVLFETLSGCRPHAALSLGALLREVAGHDAPPLSRVRADVPEPVVALVSRLLERAPGRRPADAAAVAAELFALAELVRVSELGPKSRG